MRGSERGSEVVQFAVAVPLLLFIVFGIMQVGGMMLAASQLSSDITRACRQLDVAGLQRADDKEDFIKKGVLGASTQLVPGNLHIEGVRVGESRESLFCETGGNDAMEQRSVSTELAYEVRYEIPALLATPGLTGLSFSRRVECVCVGERIVEVRLGSS